MTRHPVSIWTLETVLRKIARSSPNTTPPGASPFRLCQRSRSKASRYGHSGFWRWNELHCQWWYFSHYLNLKYYVVLQFDRFQHYNNFDRGQGTREDSGMYAMNMWLFQLYYLSVVFVDVVTAISFSYLHLHLVEFVTALATVVYR